MRGVISIPYIPLKHALYSDKVDKRGYIYGDEKRGDGMTYAEYDRKLMEEFNNFISVFNGKSYLNKKYGISEVQAPKKDNIKYEYYHINCPIFNMRKNDMQVFELTKCRAEGLMFIMIVDIPIGTLESDIESELRFWVKDSMSINIHHEIPDNKRLEMLPTKNIKIKMGDFEGELKGCRVINYEKPFRLTLLVEKAEK